MTAAVQYHGVSLVDDPSRVASTRALGIDETAFLNATRHHHATYVTSLVDLDARRLIDITPGEGASDLARWCSNADPSWLSGISVVATDLTDSYRSALSNNLADGEVVADAFHVVRVANRCLDDIRRPIQVELMGHRGGKAGPLYKIRKLLLMGFERLDEDGYARLLLGLHNGDPEDSILGAWLTKESLREVYQTKDLAEAELLLDKIIAGCLADEVPGIVTLGHTLEVKEGDPQLPQDRFIERANRRLNSSHQKGETGRRWVSTVRALQAPSTASYRRRQVAVETQPTKCPCSRHSGRDVSKHSGHFLWEESMRCWCKWWSMPSNVRA